MIIDKEKLEAAIAHLNQLYSIVGKSQTDWWLVPPAEAKELNEIEASKEYLEHLLNESQDIRFLPSCVRCAWCNKSCDIYRPPSNLRTQSISIGMVQGKDLPFCDDNCHQAYLDHHKRDCPTREDLENWERGLGGRT